MLVETLEAGILNSLSRRETLVSCEFFISTARDSTVVKIYETNLRAQFVSPRSYPQEQVCANIHHLSQTLYYQLRIKHSLFRYTRLVLTEQFTFCIHARNFTMKALTTKFAIAQLQTLLQSIGSFRRP